jgi:hypothetical protein
MGGAFKKKSSSILIHKGNPYKTYFGSIDDGWICGDCRRLFMGHDERNSYVSNRFKNEGDTYIKIIR